jgi:hypothetical protein
MPVTEAHLPPRFLFASQNLHLSSSSTETEAGHHGCPYLAHLPPSFIALYAHFIATGCTSMAPSISRSPASIAPSPSPPQARGGTVRYLPVPSRDSCRSTSAWFCGLLRVRGRVVQGGGRAPSAKAMMRVDLGQGFLHPIGCHLGQFLLQRVVSPHSFPFGCLDRRTPR